MLPPPKESAVMGRTAVSVVVGFWQLIPFGYVLGLSGSAAVTEESSTLLPAVWSACIFLAGCLMGVVYLLPREPDKAAVEIAVLVTMAAGALTYLIVILDRADSLDGQLAVLAVLGALVVNFVGRGFLLARQLLTFRKVVKS